MEQEHIYHQAFGHTKDGMVTCGDEMATNGDAVMAWNITVLKNAVQSKNHMRYQGTL